MKKVLFWLALCISSTAAMSILPLAAQSPEADLALLLSGSASTSSSRGYTAADKSAIEYVSFQDNILTLRAPLAQKDGTGVQTYFITRGHISYKTITETASVADLKKIKDSSAYPETGTGAIYSIQDNKLVLRLPIDPEIQQGDIYITIAPDVNSAIGNYIEDYTINLQKQTPTNATLATDTLPNTQVLADNYSDPTSDKAVTSVSCVWAKDKDAVTLSWDANTALNASKVEIYHRGDTNQGPMDLVTTVNLTDKSATIDTPHRNAQLFRLKPVSSNGAMVGTEVQYTCAADNADPIEDTLSQDESIDETTSHKVTTLTVVPETGPKETIALVVLVTAIAYVLYKKMRKA